MIELRPYRDEDGEALAGNLHEVSADEIWAVGIDELLPHLAFARTRGVATSCFIDGVLAFVGATASDTRDPIRTTSFFMAKGANEAKLGLALRRWAAQEKARFPGVRFVSQSFSWHPQRDRFLALAGLHKVRTTTDSAVFST